MSGYAVGLLVTIWAAFFISDIGRERKHVEVMAAIEGRQPCTPQTQ